MEPDRAVLSGRERARLRLHLVGGDHPDGEVPLDRLGQVAEHTQELVLRIARGLSGREGAGRTPAPLRAATRLLLVGIGPPPRRWTSPDLRSRQSWTARMFPRT